MANIINVGTGSKKRLHFKHQKLVFIIVILVLAGVGAYLGLVAKPWINWPSGSKVSEPDYSYNSVVSNVNETNYPKAVALLDTQAAQAKDDNAKISAYFQQFSLALKMKKYDEALRYAQLADSVRSYSETSSAIAKSYAAKGDKQQAIAYYKKAISQLDQATEAGQTDTRDYNKAITELGG